MPIAVPKIYNRSYDDIVAETEKLAAEFTSDLEVAPMALYGYTLAEDVVNPSNHELIAANGTLVDAALAEQIRIAGLERVKVKGWQLPETSSAAERTAMDAGRALIRIFARMVELVADRLNQVPEKNFLAFLDLIGTQILPPQPARVPLTFRLAAGSPVDRVVPARTQAAAPPPPGEKTEVVFETERDLLVTRSQLNAVFVRDPGADRYGDYTLRAMSLVDKDFAAFAGEPLIEHSLYLAWDDFFTLPEPKSATLNFDWETDASALAPLIVWEYWDGAHWEKQDISSTTAPTQWQVTIDPLPALTLRTIAGLTAGWLRARLNAPLPANPPQVKGITASVSIERGGLSPESAFTNVVPIDLSKDFYPFGERPRFNDTLYLSSREVFAKADATVTITITLSNPNPDQQRPSDIPPPSPFPVVASKDLVMIWEVWNGSAWKELGQSTPTQESAGTTDFHFRDETRAFTRHHEDTPHGTVAFTLPQQTDQSTVNGVASHWVRARILKGNYGIEAYYRQISETPPVSYELVPATFAPPSIKTLSLRYTYQPSGPPSACLTYNNFTYKTCMADSPFTPFTPAEGPPTLYLGFDQPFDNRPVTLYAGVEPPLYDAVASAGGEDAAAAGSAQVIWEYSSPTDSNSITWTRLGVRDETRAFAERGLIRFVGPKDFTAGTEFGLSRYWLRARWVGGAFDVPPRLRRLLTNTTWASQATTVLNEVLGSSDGSPNQIFRTARAPVLLGQRVEVREREAPAPAERAALEALEGKDAIAAIPDAAGRLRGVWVRWHEVPDFYGSGPRDRHYVLDHLAGEVRFGDGQHGMVPPQDRNNVRAALYRTGGGVRGNRPAGTIVQLKSAVPYVGGVTNYEAAGGGAEQESLEEVKERGPRFLRHRGRAVTAQDFEDLAYEASPEVALARAIGARDSTDAGRVALILVPRSAGPQPIPSLELINRVEDYILAHCDPTVELGVAGPDWVQVTVTAEVVPESPEVADAIGENVRSALQGFLHPLTGGLDRQGWPFGRAPHTSDLYALIEAVDGVDHVRSLSVDQKRIGTVLPDRFLVFSGTHIISVVSPDEEG